MSNILQWIQAQTTGACNGKCIICPHKDSWFSKNPGYMSDELYEKILNDIADYDPVFFGKFCPYMCNEPFADKKIVKRLDLARQILADPYLEVSSNLVLATRNQIDELIRVYEQNGFYGRIMVSFHGYDKETYERVMGLPFETALNNTIYLLGQSNGRIPIYIHCATASRDNKYVLADTELFSNFWNGMLSKRNITKKNVLLYPLKFHTRAGNVNLDEWKYERVVREIGPNNPFDCTRIHRYLHVIYTGEVVGCCCDYNRETVLGDLTTMNIKDVFNSDTYKNWVKSVKGEIESPPDFLCKRCTWPGG